MTLLDRLHPYYKDKLEKANLEYPEFVSSISDDLEEVQFVTDLKFGTILDLNTFCGVLPSPFDYFTE